MQADGHLVNYKTNNEQYWNTNITGSFNILVIYNDGRLVVKDSKSDEVKWTGNTISK